MSTRVPSSETRLRVVLVGRTGLDQSLRREPSVELIRARGPFDAIGEVGDPIDADSPARSLVVVGADADPGHESEQFVAAIRLADPRCKVIVIEHGINTHARGSYDAVIPPNASLAMLRRLALPADAPAPGESAQPVHHEPAPKALEHAAHTPEVKTSEAKPPALPIAHTNGHATPKPAAPIEVIEHREPHHEHRSHQEHKPAPTPPPLPSEHAAPAPRLPKEFELPAAETPSAPKVFHVRPHEPAPRAAAVPPPLPSEPVAQSKPALKKLIVPEPPPIILGAYSALPPPLPIIAAPPTDIETARQLAKQPSAEPARPKSHLAKVHPESPKPAEHTSAQTPEPEAPAARPPTVAEMLAAWAPVKTGATPPPLPVETPRVPEPEPAKADAAPTTLAPIGTGVSVGTPTDDAELLHAALSGRDITEPALKVIRKRLGRADVILAPISAEPSSGVRVEHRGKHYGHLLCAGLDAKALAPHALWLGDWLTLRDQHEALKKAALYDELTGAYNRRYFDGFLKEAIDQARRSRTSVTLMVFDVDNFKRFNDEHGHAAGDEILKSTVALLRSVIREGDRVCRIGGDEFVVVFSEPAGPREPGSKPPTDVASIAARFQKQIAGSRFPMLGDDAPGALSISGGLATYPWDGHTPAELLERADQLALESKRAGKNCITIGPGTQRSMR
jgi:diguanylate cyclase (GGDEF)-like protein